MTFIVDKSTSFGESVRVVGSISQLGAWDVANSIALSSDDYRSSDPIWDITIDVPCGTNAKYKYLLDSEETTRWESTPNRNFNANSGSLTIRDAWEGSSFTTTISSALSTSISSTSTSSRQPSATACVATFVVNKSTEFGESVRIVGSTSQLGSWDPTGSITMNPDKYTSDNPIWYTTLTFPIASVVEYKYLSEANSATTWETTPNRNLDMGSCKSSGGSLTIQDSWEGSTPTSGGPAAPSPTQDGLSSACSDFYQVKSGDGCYNIANDNGISLNDFYSYNPGVGNDCSKLYLDYYVCLGTSGSAPSVTTSAPSSSSPSPTQDGLASNCAKFYKVQSGDGCYDIADDSGISLNDFYSFNPAVGSDCAKLWPDYYVCVGTSG